MGGRAAIPRRAFKAVRVMVGEGHSVHRACRVLPESGYHAWCDRPPSARTVRHTKLTEAIIGIHAASRVDAELTLGLGIHMHHGAVELLMRRADLYGRPGNRTRLPRPVTPSVADLAATSHQRFARLLPP